MSLANEVTSGQVEGYLLIHRWIEFEIEIIDRLQISKTCKLRPTFDIVHSYRLLPIAKRAPQRVLNQS